MRLMFFFLACLYLIAGCSQGDAERAASDSRSDQRVVTKEMFKLDDFARKKRPLLVFAESAEDPRLETQDAEIVSHAAGLAERDMVVVRIVGDEVTVDGRAVAADRQAIRQTHGIENTSADGFAVLLIGKDTGIKLRRSEPLAIEEVFALIDTMPMRRQEMERRGI